MKVLLFGATGNVGKKIASELKEQGYEFSVVVRNHQKANEIKSITSNCIIADVTNPSSLHGVCSGFEVVISSLGKSVSPNDKSRPSFRDIDYTANLNVLNEAIRSGIKKFVYVSVFHAEKYPDLEYFRTHFDFEQKLKASGIDYSIIRPPAIFSSFIDLVSMAKKGKLMTIGKGDKKTNPIYEGDLAKICIGSIHQKNAIIEAGGREVFTRKEINELIQNMVAPDKKLRSVPPGMIQVMLPLIKLWDRNSYDKFAFFLAVMKEDILAQPTGQTRLEEYIKVLNNKSFPVL